MVFIISDVLERKILKEMNQSDYFSLMLDETTDCNVTEQLAIHGHFIDVDAGELKSHYLKIIDLLQPETVEDCDTQLDISISVNAETIANRVCEFTTNAELDTTKMRGIGTDSAATMTGCHNGVVARLKRITPSAIGVHCAAHRLNLASSQAGNAVPYIKKFNSIIPQIFDFYDNNAVANGRASGYTDSTTRERKFDCSLCY